MKTSKELIQEFSDSLMVEMAKLGEGGRFKALVKELEKKKGITDPEALAAKIGRSKYGKKKMAGWAAKGK